MTTLWLEGDVRSVEGRWQTDSESHPHQIHDVITVRGFDEEKVCPSHRIVLLVLVILRASMFPLVCVVANLLSECLGRYRLTAARY